MIVLIALSATAKAGRHSASDTLGYYDTTISGWNGFSFFIGLLPAAYTYAALGMISSMAEEVRDPAVVSRPKFFQAITASNIKQRYISFRAV